MKKILMIIVCLFMAASAQALMYGTPVAIEGDNLGGVVVQNGDTPFPIGAIFPVAVELRLVPSSYLKVVGGKIVAKTSAEVAFVNLPMKYKKQVDGVWVELTAEEKAAVDAAAETSRQAAKPAMQKTVENLYVQFLGSDWTDILRTNGIIGAEATITVENTDSTQNITYLMTLRAMDRVKYVQFASEFKLFEDTLREKFGTELSDARLHTDMLGVRRLASKMGTAITTTVNKQRTTSNYTGAVGGTAAGLIGGIVASLLLRRKNEKTSI